jgi:hypothetical protein
MRIVRYFYRLIIILMGVIRKFFHFIYSSYIFFRELMFRLVWSGRFSCHILRYFFKFTNDFLHFQNISPQLLLNTSFSIFMRILKIRKTLSKNFFVFLLLILILRSSGIWIGEIIVFCTRNWLISLMIVIYFSKFILYENLFLL